MTASRDGTYIFNSIYVCVKCECCKPLSKMVRRSIRAGTSLCYSCSTVMLQIAKRKAIKAELDSIKKGHCSKDGRDKKCLRCGCTVEDKNKAIRICYECKRTDAWKLGNYH